MAVAFCVLYWVQSQNKPAARTNHELDIGLLRLPAYGEHTLFIIMEVCMCWIIPV